LLACAASSSLGFDPLDAFHEACRKRWPYADISSFRRSSLATLRRKGRNFIAQSQHDAAVAAKLWYVLRHGHEPTGHDLLDLVASWQSTGTALP
jgi:hypothetical protein